VIKPFYPALSRLYCFQIPSTQGNQTMPPVATLFIILALIAMLGVVASLLMGLGVMTRGRTDDSKTSNKMMQVRIVCQGLVILFLFLAYLAK
jgi:hypothetical protein